MQIFQIESNGETTELKSDGPIKSLIKSNQCYILSDDEARIVYLWKGKESTVRSKFIGAQKQQEVRGQVGLNYKTVSMDEEDDDITPEFKAAIEKAPKPGFAKEIKESLELKFEVGGGPVTPRVTQTNPNFNQNVEQTGPLYTGSSDIGASAGSAAAASTPSPKQERKKLELEKILASLDDAGIPDGFEREMVIMGDNAYSVAEKVQTFLGKKTVEKVLEPISSLPEGVFFAEGYVPRVLVQDKQILAIEFLKKKE
jgi:hypothetical protein